MIKYPSMYTPKQFTSILSKVPELLDETAYIQPKYDGSNITCLAQSCLTRNLNPLPPQFREGLKRALGDRYGALMNLSMRYQVFLELGGERNSPAGYSDPWEGEWDYRVFDLYAGQFLRPEKVEKILSEYGLKYVGFTTAKVEDVVDGWTKMLSQQYKVYEGFVVKVYPSMDVLKKIPHHSQRNVVIVKFKHEYTGTHTVRRKKKKKKGVEGRGEKLEPLPKSEIMAAINRAHLQLGDDIYDKRRAMPLIFKLVREEAEKHGYAVPRAGVVFKYYQEYLMRDRLRREERLV